MKSLFLCMLLFSLLTSASDTWPLNGSAELGSGGWIGVNWTDRDFVTGRYCFEAVLKKQPLRVKPWYAMQTRSSEKYVFAAWVRSDGNDSCSVSIRLTINGKRTQVLLPSLPIPRIWTLIEGHFTSKQNGNEILPELLIAGNPGSVILIDDISCNAAQAQLVDCEVNHRKNLLEDADQGHRFDKAYYDAGTSIDIVLFDFDELKRQGQKVPINLRHKAENAQRQLRQKWLTLCTKREDFWRDYSRTNKNSKDLKIFRSEIASFCAEAETEAKAIVEESLSFRNNLVYTKNPTSVESWKNKFLLAYDVENTFYGANRLQHPGNYINYEYAAKACNNLGVDFVSILSSPLGKTEKENFLGTFERYCQAPFLPWSTDREFFGGGDLINFKYFTDRGKMLTDINAFLAFYNQYPSCAGVQIDEPLIADSHSRYGKLKIEKAWQEYLKKRSDFLQENSLDQTCMSLEWKLFKKDFLADHVLNIYQTIEVQGKFPLACIMNQNPDDASKCSYVSLGRKLPIASTDLYNNGNAIESFSLSLFKNAMHGQALLIPGAGYSCKTPDALRRSISNGLVHADGIHMWTSTYAWKYRDPNYFWRTGGHSVNMDDRRRNAFYNWFPWIWDILRERYHYAAKNNALLTGRSSLAQTAVLVSERTLLTKAPYWYWNDNLAIYEQLLRDGVPADACFLETLTPEQWLRYKVLIAPGMRTITPAELERLRQWVAQGGTLLVTPDFACCDEWGRNKTDRDTFGVLFTAERLSNRINILTKDGFRFNLLPEAVALIRKTITTKTQYPWQIENLPSGIEVQFQKNAEGTTLLQLLDFVDNREVSGHILKNTSNGQKKPLRSFHIHDMIVLK